MDLRSACWTLRRQIGSHLPGALGPISPRMLQRSPMPSMNSSGMPDSVRVGSFSAARPRQEKPILIATSGRAGALRLLPASTPPQRSAVVTW